MSVKGTPIAHLHQDQQQQQHADLSLWRERTTSRSTQNLNHHRHHHHHISSQLGLDQEPNHHVANSNSQNMLHGLTNSHSTTQHTTEIIAMSSPRGRDQSEEAEERGRSRLREDKLDVTDDSFDDISLMGFKTGSKHNSPVKMKKVR